MNDDSPDDRPTANELMTDVADKASAMTDAERIELMHDLLGIDIPLADQLPEETRSAGFSTVADGQAMSHFQLERQLAVVDSALDEAFRRALSPPDDYERDFSARDVARRNPRRRTARNAETRTGCGIAGYS